MSPQLRLVKPRHKNWSVPVRLPQLGHLPVLAPDAEPMSHIICPLVLIGRLSAAQFRLARDSDASRIANSVLLERVVSWPLRIDCFRSTDE
jgi:hypothetical protein